MTSDAEIRALIDELDATTIDECETYPVDVAIRCAKAAAALSELLAERDGCDPDGCKEHIDAFMRRAEAAEACVKELEAQVRLLREEVAFKMQDIRVMQLRGGRK